MENLSELQRILAVFAKPNKAMEDIGSRPAFLVPVMCMIIFPLLAIVINIGYYRDQLMVQMAAQMQAMGMGSNLGAMVQVSLIGMLAAAPVMGILGWLLYSLMVLILAHIFGGDGEFGYKKALSVTGYAYLVTVPFTVLSAVLILINPEFAITFSLADLMKLIAPVENTYALSLLQMVSVYKLWEMALVAVGMHRIKQMPMAKAVAAVVIIFVLQYAVQIGSLAMSSGLLGQAG